MRAAVVGLGRFGLVHLNIYRRMVAQGSLAGIVVHDVDPDRVEHVLDAPYVEPFDPMHVPDDVRAASVCVPPPQHASVARPLLAAGVDVLVEKPLTLARHDALALVRDAAASPGRLWAGHSERFNIAFDVLRTFKTPWRRVSTWRMGVQRPVGVDVVFDLMIHDLDMLCVVCGGEVLEVDALGVAHGGCLEHVQACLQFSHGVGVTLQASYGVTHAQRGWVLEDRAGRLTRLDLCSPYAKGAGPVDRELAALVSVVRDGVQPSRWGLATGEAGAQAVALAQRIVNVTRRVSVHEFSAQSVGPSY